MAGLLSHSPAFILRATLVALGLGSEPGSGGAWPVYATSEPSDPDAVLTIYNTAGRDDGRTMIDGERQERHGFQVRVRSGTEAMGYSKARTVALALDGLWRQGLLIEGVFYRIQSVTRTTDVLSLGREAPTSQRRLFTVNGLVALRQE